MRISYRSAASCALRLVSAAAVTITLTAAAHAACRSDALGTHRTIKIDPQKVSYVRGKERALGLRHKEVILTFDDGPIAGKTPRILEALKRECVRATFFYVGRMARAYPRLVRRVVAHGHTLAHHTQNHNRLPAYSSKKASELIDRGVVSLQKVAYGINSAEPKVPFFRYPYLARSARTDRILRKKGLIDFGANIDALDWKIKSANKIHNRIMRRLRREGRGIILMHDIHARTAKMLPRLLRSLKKEGYKVVHVVPGGKAQPKKPTGGETDLLVASIKSEQSTASAKTPRSAKIGASGQGSVTDLPELGQNDALIAEAVASANAVLEGNLRPATAPSIIAPKQKSGPRVRVVGKRSASVTPPGRDAGRTGVQIASAPKVPAVKRETLQPKPVEQDAPKTSLSDAKPSAGEPAVAVDKAKAKRKKASKPLILKVKRKKTVTKLRKGQVAKRTAKRRIKRTTSKRTTLKTAAWKLRRSQWILR